MKTSDLYKKIRQGKVLSEIEEKFLQDSEAQENAKRQPPKKITSLFDLEVTRSCWHQDGLSVEK